MTAEITNHDLMRAITDFAERTEQRFEGIDKRFEGVDGHFESFDQRFDHLELRFTALEIQFRTHLHELHEIRVQVDATDGRLIGVENDIKEIYFSLPVRGVG